MFPFLEDLMMTVPLQKTISTNYALRAIPSYTAAAFIGTILCPIFGIIAMVNAFKVCSSYRF